MPNKKWIANIARADLLLEENIIGGLVGVWRRLIRCTGSVPQHGVLLGLNGQIALRGTGQVTTRLGARQYQRSRPVGLHSKRYLLEIITVGTKCSNDLRWWLMCTGHGDLLHSIYRLSIDLDEFSTWAKFVDSIRCTIDVASVKIIISNRANKSKL